MAQISTPAQCPTHNVVKPNGHSDPTPGALIAASLAGKADHALTPWHIERLRSAASRCAANGFRRIALFGGGRHTQRIVRQPWAELDIQVVAIIDDDPKSSALRGVPLFTPDRFDLPVDAIVVSSDMYEQQLLARAIAVFGGAAGRPRIPVHAVYGETPDSLAALHARLVKHWRVSARDAQWLIDNRAERHDATLPVLPAERTELHLRRYELAATLAAGQRCLDAACGTGYGSQMLLNSGARSYVGIDIDPEAIDYASRRFDHPHARFECRSVTDTGFPVASFDLITSFETIEHVPDLNAFVDEMARLLTPGGTLVLSTPNDAGLTDFHVHSFTRESLEHTVARRFQGIRFFAQRATDTPTLSGPGAGIEPWRADSSLAPETWIIVAQKPH